MASASKKAYVRFTAEQVRELIENDQSEGESDIDSHNGGLSSGEEFELDQELQERSDEDSESR